MADLIYQVSVGNPSRLYGFCQESVQKYAEAVGADYHLQTEPILKIRPNPAKCGRSREATERLGYLPIFEKENAFDYLHLYERVAIIDSDVWVRPGSPNIFEELGDADFAGVRERDMPSTPKHRKKLRNFSRAMFKPFKDVEWDWKNEMADFWNMGMMLMGGNFVDYLHGESAKQFLQRPEFVRFINGEGFLKWSTDQTLLNWWSRKCGMKRKCLDWRWNALYGACKQDRIRKAHLIHFFLRDNLPQKGENIEQLMKCVSQK